MFTLFISCISGQVKHSHHHHLLKWRNQTAEWIDLIWAPYRALEKALEMQIRCKEHFSVAEQQASNRHTMKGHLGVEQQVSCDAAPLSYLCDIHWASHYL